MYAVELAILSVHCIVDDRFIQIYQCFLFFFRFFSYLWIFFFIFLFYLNIQSKNKYSTTQQSQQTNTMKILTTVKKSLTLQKDNEIEKTKQTNEFVFLIQFCLCEVLFMHTL